MNNPGGEKVCETRVHKLKWTLLLFRYFPFSLRTPTMAPPAFPTMAPSAPPTITPPASPTIAPPASPTSSYYSVADVLAVANIHPFYVSSIKYPPSTQTITSLTTAGSHTATKHATHPSQLTLLQTQPLLRKPNLYTTIQRLINDASPFNTYRHGIYASTTGGGSGSKPLFFGTDVHENRRQRHLFGRFLAATGVIAPGDWVATIHSSGGLYRSLDLTLEIMENAGASMLALGHGVPPAKLVQAVADYHANVLSGDGSQVVAMAHFISGLSADQRARLQVVDKVIYTSETLTAAQAGYIRSVLGAHVSICSVMGSAEAGPYAVNNPALTAGMEEPDATVAGGYVDFVYDTRAVLFEILPIELSPEQDSHPSKPLPDGEVGMIVQTSLARLRNPLVRYVTGDVGSLHRLPEQARSLVAEEDWPFLRVLRHRGRDGRFSFEWAGEYVEFDGLTALMNDEKLGILKWQVILNKMETTESMLEVRVLLGLLQDSAAASRRESLVEERIWRFCHVIEGNKYRFRLQFVDSLGEFELSTTGNKVVRFVDRFNL